MKFSLLLTLICLFSCSKKPEIPANPDEALKAFIDARVGKVIDKDFILDRITGKMLAEFKAMDEAELKHFWSMQNVQTDSFKMVDKKCEPTHCSLTYSVGYSTKTDGRVAFVSNVNKIAQMELVDNQWLISDVQNVSTHHESLEPINVHRP